MADEMRKIMIKRFEKQDVKEGYYDVAFKIGDEVLYAHRFLLSTVSEPFDAMFSENWKKTSDPIEIKTCSSFETFKQFIAYFYHGTCNFDEKNIFDIIDLAEMYQVHSLKDKLDIFTSEMSFTSENIYQLLEASEIYGFKILKKSLSNYLVANWYTLLFERDDFLGVGENVLLGLLGLDRDGIDKIENALFVKIFEWSEKSAKQKNSNFDSLNVEEQQAMIKAEMTPFLSKFQFGCRSMDFLNGFVAPKSYLFDDYDAVVVNALQNRDKLLDDDPDLKFWLKLQILPSNFNNRYNQVLRGLIYSHTKEPLEEFVNSVQSCQKVNGAYSMSYKQQFQLNHVDKLGCYDYDQKYFMGVSACSVSSEFMLIDKEIFRYNDNIRDRYTTICDLEGKNFPEFDEDETNFCIQLL